MKRTIEKYIAIIATILLVIKSYNPVIVHLNNNIYLAIFFLIGGIIILLSKNMKELLIRSIPIFLAGLFYIINGNGILLFTVLSVICICNTKFEKTAKVLLISELIMFNITVVCSLCGVIDSGTWYTGNIVRSDLGFGNPNTTSLRVFIISILAIYLYEKNFISKKMTIICSLVIPSIILLFITFTRTTILIYIFVILIYYFGLKRKLFYEYEKKYKYLKYLLSSTTYILMIITITITNLFYENDMLNKIFSRRPAIWHDIIYKFKLYPTLIGRDNSVLSDLSNKNGYSLDSSYISILSVDGLIVGGIVLSLISFVLWNLINKEMYIEVIVIMAFLIYSFMENILLNSMNNISLLLVGQICITYCLNYKKGEKRVLI